jgi:Tol biopolymer transport system component/predicted Ser/Thr protein kinase
MIGRTITHYRITEKLGEGGMGVVYKAEDTKLKRPVALKFLAAHLLNDGEIKARFQREAESAAALTHTNIAVIYEIDESDGHSFIAMEFIEGPTVGEKITERPLRLEEALDIAIQAAQGLQVAHERGIVHRDIKSANLMVTPQGQVKVMDFGLAQLAERSKLTETTTILGTPSYMSPEQAVGEKTDRRTDLWSLGVVAYEMVAGRLPFGGERQEAVLYGITNEEPEPLTALRAGLPMELEWIIGKALAKNREERYQHSEDLLVDVRSLRKKLASGKSTIIQAGSAGAVVTGAHAGPTQPSGQNESPAPLGPLAKYRVIEDIAEADDSVKYLAEDTELHRSVAIRVLPQSSEQQIEKRRRLQQRAVLGMAALLTVSLAFSALLWFRDPSSDSPEQPVRFSFTPENLVTIGSVNAIISPNGRHIVLVSEEEGARVLWVRDLDRAMPRKLEGTEGAEDPFWSPDSQSIGFGTDAELKRISVNGGESITLCDLPQAGAAFFGGSWSSDGEQIVYSASFQLFQVPSRGGTPKLLFEPEEAENSAHFSTPQFLPVTEGSRGLVYTSGPPNGRKLEIMDLETGERREMVPGNRPVYSTSGHLLYEVGSSLRALPFSLKTLTAAGEAFPIVDAGDDPSVALDGTLVYTDADAGRRNLVWRDREGKKLGTIGQAQESIIHLALSPDGDRVAVEAQEDGNHDIWVHDAVRGAKTRLTFDPSRYGHPAWLPSGEQITFYSAGGGSSGILSKPFDGSGEAALLAAEEHGGRSPDWSRDGKFVIYHTTRGEDTGEDLWYLKPKASGEGYEPTPYLTTEAAEQIPVFSPDGRYVAYVSGESGRREIYVRPFPEGGGKWQISTNGGAQPRWRRGGGELFYVEEDQLMAVSVSTAQGFSPGTPKLLFRDRSLRSPFPKQQYDVSADGQRFVLIGEVEGESSKPAAVRVVQNWFAEFKNRKQN